MIAVVGVSLYFIYPLFFLRNTYTGEIKFNLTGEDSFEKHSYHVGNHTLGPYELEKGYTVSVEETSSPCGSSKLQFHHILLIDQKTGEIVDVGKIQVLNPTKLKPPSNGTYLIGIGVLKHRLYPHPENSIGNWTLEITITKPFFNPNSHS